MQSMINDGHFIEHAVFSDNMYGTRSVISAAVWLCDYYTGNSKQSVRDVRDQGKICVLDIDMQVSMFYAVMWLVTFCHRVYAV